MSRLFVLLSLVLCLLAPPALAQDGTVYVPLLMNVSKDGHRVVTEVTLTNFSNSRQTFTELLIPRNVNGVNLDRRDALTRSLGARSSTSLQSSVGNGGLAMVELTLPPEIVVTSRLVVTSGVDGRGAEVPVLSSDNLIPAGRKAYLQGWIRDLPNLRTDFHFINLGESSVNCTIVIQDTAGRLLHSGYSFGLGGLRLFSLSDALSLLNVNGLEQVVLSFDCDQPYFPFATVHDAQSGGVTFVSPAGSGASTLRAPTGGRIVHEEPGLFHRPTVGNESIRFNYSFPGNPTFSKIFLEMDFKHGGWNPFAVPQVSDNHAIFWLHRGSRWRENVFGYVNAFGPESDFVKSATNAGQADMQSKAQSVTLQPGVTYHVEYEYDTTAGFYEVRITQGGQEIVRIRDVATVNTIRTIEGLWFVDIGHMPGAVGPEIPSYNWEYSNLRVEWVP